MSNEFFKNSFVRSSSNLSEQLQYVLRNLVDDKLGIIRQIIEEPIHDEDVDVFVAGADCTDSFYLRELAHPNRKFEIPASGASLTREDCIWATVGEACERYAATLYDKEHILYAKPSELNSSVFQLEKLILFSRKQYENPSFHFSPLNKDLSIGWAKGFDLTDNRNCYIPAQVVWLGYEAASKQEIFGPQNSTGLAAGQSLENAIYSGLLEVIERDAFTCNWILKKAIPDINHEWAINVAPKLKNFILNPDMNVFIKWATTDIDVPTIITMLQPKNSGGVVIGAACNLDISLALEKSVVEAYHTWHWAHAMMLRPGFPSLKAENVTTFEEHVKFHVDKNNLNIDNKPYSQFWLDKNKTIEPPSISTINEKNKISVVIQKLRELGFKVYYVDLTPRDLKEIGIYVVKVFVPGLQPLHCGFGMEHLDSRRLTMVADFLNTSIPRQWNKIPHPFP